MAFENQQSDTGISVPKELKLRKDNFIKEIGVLGIEHEKISNEIKRIKVERAGMKDTKKEIKALEVKKEKLLAKDFNLGIKISEQEKKLDALEKQHLQMVVAFNLEFSDKKVVSEQKLSEIIKEIDKILPELLKLKTDKNNVMIEVTALEKDADVLKDKIEILKKDYAKLKNENKELPEKEKEKNQLKSDIVELETQRKDLGDEIKSFFKEKEKIQNEVSEAKSKAEKFEKEKTEIRDKFNKEMKAETEALDKRDGLISEKEGWVKQKEQDLRKTKAELEKFYNRKISHIII